MARPDLRELMQRSQGGDQAAYRTLLLTIQPMIRAFLRRRLGRDDAADDISQDCLLRIHAYRHTFDPTYPFEPWMYTLLKSALYDYWRSRKRKPLALAESFDGDTLASGEDDTLRLEFMQAFEQLTPKEQHTIARIKGDGLSHEEYAQETGLSVGAVKVRAHRAYQSLKRALKG